MRRFRNETRGAVFVEFALVLPLIVGFLFALIELPRFSAVRTVLAYSAGAGLLTAQSMQELEYDPFISDELDYEAMKEAKRKVSAEATRVARDSLGWLFGGEVPFYRFRHVTIDRDLNKGADTIDALILVPGESAIQLRPGEELRGLVESGSIWRDHPDKCAIQSRDCVNVRGDSKKDRREFTGEMVFKFPIVVEVSVEFRPLFSWLSPIQLTGIAAGYREVSPKLPKWWPDDIR